MLTCGENENNKTLDEDKINSTATAHKYIFSYAG